MSRLTKFTLGVASVCLLTLVAVRLSDGYAQDAGVDPAAREIAVFKKVFTPIAREGYVPSVAQAKSAAGALDDIVVTLLNQGRSLEFIEKVLASLETPGHEELPVQSDRTPDWPRYESAFTVFQVPRAPAPFWVAAYSFGSFGCGHLSVISRLEGRWRSAGGLDSPCGERLFAFPLVGRASTRLAVVRHNYAADGWSGDLQVWEVVGETLERRGGEHHVPFYEVYRHADGLGVTYGVYPECLHASVSQMQRNRIDLILRRPGDGPEVTRRTATPWVAAVDAACAAVKAGSRFDIPEPYRAAALEALDGRALLLWDTSGDAVTGQGTVALGDTSAVRFRFDVKRWLDGAWRISAVSRIPSRRVSERR